MRREFRYGVRMLLRSPGFAITAILTLGLAIGANTAVFALLDAVLLKPLPYPQPERLALVSRVTQPRRRALLRGHRSYRRGVGIAARSRLERRCRGVLRPLGTHQSGGRRSRHQRGAAARERGILPRARRPSRQGPRLHRQTRIARAVRQPRVLSDRLWRSVFAADASVVGTTVLLKGEPHLVVGVMPASFKSSVRRRSLDAAASVANR